MSAKLKVVPEKPPAEAWRDKLAEATGNWVFVLSMSRRMVFALQCVVERHTANGLHGKPSPLGPHSGHWVPAVNSLMNRGLVIHEPKWIRQRDGRLLVDLHHYPYKLTPAGECVVRLLQFAGLLKESQ